MFPREQRLTRKRDLDRVYKLGSSAGTRWFFIRSLPNRQGKTRFTVIIGKKIAKKAVVRNRIKRLVRQAVQELLREKSVSGKVQGTDCIVTVHRDPEPPYELARLKPEVALCFDRLP